MHKGSLGVKEAHTQAFLYILAIFPRSAKCLTSANIINAYLYCSQRFLVLSYLPFFVNLYTMDLHFKDLLSIVQTCHNWPMLPVLSIKRLVYQTIQKGTWENK